MKILGAGPTGTLLALALARLGNSVTLCDPLTVEELPARSRAYALTHSSRRLLQSLDLWASLIPHLAPFTRLRLDDQELNRHTYFEVDDHSIQNQPGTIEPMLSAQRRKNLTCYRGLGTPFDTIDF